MKSLGLEYLSAAIAEPPDTFVSGGALAHLFHTDAEDKVYAYVIEHLTQHGAFPKIETISIHTGVTVPKPIEPASYYLDHLRRRHVEKSLRDSVTNAAEFMGPDVNKDPDKAFEIIADTVYELSLTEKGAKVLDFRDAKSVVISALAQQVTMGGMLGIPLGWPYLDKMTGGIQKGDLFSIVARPGMGKTWMMVYAALHAWHQGYNPLLITLEMPALQIFQRLAAIETHTPSMALKTAQVTTTQENKLKAELAALKDHERPFWIIDGQMSAGIEDALMLSSRLKPDIVLVDGAYMLKHPNPRMSRHEKVSEICDALKKDLATAMNLPVIASWQLNRDATKVKKTEKVGAEHVADSDNIARASSVILGLFEDKTPESLKSREVDVIKGRGGEDGTFRINWDFLGMDFSQIDFAHDTTDLVHI